MTFFVAIVLGLVQGLTEFLPVSSSGHLVLINKLFGCECDFVFFSVLLHFATLFSVFIVLRKEIKFLLLHPFSKQAMNLYFATFPTVMIVLCFKALFEDAFSGKFLPICFLVTACILGLTQLLTKKIQTKTISTKSSFLIGLAQGIAVLPGISRSGATICTALLCGIGKEEASKFSFLLSIPIIFASICYELSQAVIQGEILFNTPIFPTLTAFLVAFVVGLFSVKFMVKTFQKINLFWFSGYLIIISFISFLVI